MPQRSEATNSVCCTQTHEMRRRIDERVGNGHSDESEGTVHRHTSHSCRAKAQTKATSRRFAKQFRSRSSSVQEWEGGVYKEAADDTYVDQSTAQHSTAERQTSNNEANSASKTDSAQKEGRKEGRKQPMNGHTECESRQCQKSEFR